MTTRNARTSRRVLCLLIAVLAVSLLVSGTPGAATNERAAPFLTRTFGLSSSEMRRIDAGSAVARTLDADDGREVATLGIVRVAVPPEFFARRLADIANFKKNSEAVLQIGTFRELPQTADVHSLTLTAADVDDLRSCRIADCDVQLPAEFIERLRTVDWKRPGAEQQANAVMRENLVRYVGRYRTSGAEGLLTYVDKSKPVALAHEFRDLLEDDRRVLPQFPGLRQYLLSPLTPSTSVTSDVIYWSQERLGRKPVLSVTHLVIWRPSGASPADYVAASKQLYASHYFDASLGLTIMIGEKAGSSPVTYVAYLNRSRVDMFGGVFGGITRALVKSKTRGAAADNMERLKAGLERAFQRGN